MVEPVSLTISTVTAFWDLATSLFDLAGKFREQDATRRAEVSRYFADIADCLDKTAASLAKGEYPDGQCAALGTHANNLQKTIGDYIGKSEAKRRAQQLRQAHAVEGMFPEIKHDARLRETELPKLTAAAGVFRALSQIVAAQSGPSRRRPPKVGRRRSPSSNRGSR